MKFVNGNPVFLPYTHTHIHTEKKKEKQATRKRKPKQRKAVKPVRLFQLCFSRGRHESWFLQVQKSTHSRLKWLAECMVCQKNVDAAYFSHSSVQTAARLRMRGFPQMISLPRLSVSQKEPIKIFRMLEKYMAVGIARNEQLAILKFPINSQLITCERQTCALINPRVTAGEETNRHKRASGSKTSGKFTEFFLHCRL